MSKLSILIPTMEKRKHKLDELFNILLPQCEQYDVKVLTDLDPNLTIGAKRNNLVHRCKTQYAVFIDDDDMVSANYIELIMKGINADYDVIGINGVMTWNGNSHGTYHHSLSYEWSESGTIPNMRYERSPNHWNPMRTKYFKQFPFPSLSWAEDIQQSQAMAQAGLWKDKKEYTVEQPIHWYKYVPKK